MWHLFTRYNYGAWFGAAVRELLKPKFLLTDIHQTNVLAFDELECDKNVLQFLRSRQRLLVVVSFYFLVRKDL